ncbi:MAG: MotA/TolQ/ExbB proton channel family protein [Lentisphaerae bacterium]|nr:MotA/TolQ/ExbB proton channel family protein [Lentisphaerota bacterium]
MSTPRRHHRTTAAAILAAVCLAAAALPAAEALDTAIAKAEADLAAQRQTLAEAYAEIGAEKQALVSETAALRQRLEALRRETAALEQRAQADRRGAADLDARRDRDRQQAASLAAMALDYRRAFETRLSAAEAGAAGDALEALDRAFGSQADTLTPETLDQLCRLSLQRGRDSLGGHRQSGQAVDDDGRILNGTGLTFGPLAFFQAEDGRAGLAVQPVGSLHPALYDDVTPAQQAALRELFEKGRAAVPVDVTMGHAIRLNASRDTLTGHLAKGGIVMVPLLVLGALCALVIVGKAIQVTTLIGESCRPRAAEIAAAVRNGDLEQAQALTARLGRPLRAVLQAGIAQRQASRERLEEVLFERIAAEVPPLERFLGTLAVSASAAPLLGLLGTVTGMIHTFRLITVFGSGDARLLSSGISEALITTEVGLVIAIPALLSHAYLARRVRQAVSLVQEAAVMFANGLHAQPPEPPA